MALSVAPVVPFTREKDAEFMADPNQYDILRHYEDTITQCFRCGLCRSVCPSFEEIGLETATPRGRVQMAGTLLDGKIGLDRAFQDHMLDCLNCMRCAVTCPSGVRTDRIVLAARAELARRGKLNLIKKLVFNTVLRSPAALDSLTRIAAWGQHHFYENMALLEALVPKFAGMNGKKFPSLSRHHALDRLPSLVPAGGSRVMRVGYFVGCATNLIFPEIADSVARVLTRNGVELVIPRGQVCCGIPVYSSGDFRNARGLAERNLSVFKGLGLDCIITDCASCSSALKHEAQEILGVGPFEVPVYDITEFLANRIELSQNFGEVDLTVTYHDPCHLKRGQNIFREPRELLRMVPGVKYTEMDEADRCCGGAGTFSYTHHELSRTVGARKSDSIRRTGADYVAVPCPSCKMQLDDLLQHEGMQTRTIHPVEVLDQAYQAYDAQRS